MPSKIHLQDPKAGHLRGGHLDGSLNEPSVAVGNVWHAAGVACLLAYPGAERGPVRAGVSVLYPRLPGSFPDHLIYVQYP